MGRHEAERPAAPLSGHVAGRASVRLPGMHDVRRRSRADSGVVPRAAEGSPRGVEWAGGVIARLSIPVVATSSDTPLLKILPRSGWPQLDLRELWAYRELLYFFVWRDIKVRYKQTVVGVAWAVIQPLFMMAAFSLFFGTLARLPSDGLPYP